MPGIVPQVKVSERLSGQADCPQDVREILFSLAEDIVAIKAAINGITAKLDAEAGGGVATFDTNYTALFPLASVHTVP